MKQDFHVHSNYSDGSGLLEMAGSAADAGLEAIGFADHCNVSTREDLQEEKTVVGFNMDVTYPRRRTAMRTLREREEFELDVELYDAVEIDYERDQEEAIREFLAEADFDYAIGSVHYLDETAVGDAEVFADRSDAERRAFVDDYYDAVVSLVESELFEIAGHIDLVETNEHLRGLTTDKHHEQVARAFADSRTVPEINAGHRGEWGEYDEFKPRPEFVEVLLDHDLDVTVGTDAHDPKDFEQRLPDLRAFVEELGIDPVSPFDA